MSSFLLDVLSETVRMVLCSPGSAMIKFMAICSKGVTLRLAIFVNFANPCCKRPDIVFRNYALFVRRVWIRSFSLLIKFSSHNLFWCLRHFVIFPLEHFIERFALSIDRSISGEMNLAQREISTMNSKFLQHFQSSSSFISKSKSNF